MVYLNAWLYLIIPAHSLPSGDTGKVQFPPPPAVHHHHVFVAVHESVCTEDHPSVMGDFLETAEFGDAFADDLVADVEHGVWCR